MLFRSYDADSLVEQSRRPAPELVHGAGAIAWGDGRFLVAGGLPVGVKENYLYEYDEQFRFRRRHVLESGYTLMGIQTAAYADGVWYFGCYGSPQVLLWADRSFRLLGKQPFQAALGLVPLPDGRFLVARGKTEKKSSHSARVQLALPDEKTGLRLLE